MASLVRPWSGKRHCDPTHHTVPDFLRHSARQHPHQVATIFLGARLTYRRLLEDANRFAHGLAALGVKRGDRVAIMLPNCPQTIIAYYATLSLGALAVMTNPLYAEKDDPAGRLAAPGRTAGPTAWARILSSPALPVISGGDIRRR